MCYCVCVCVSVCDYYGFCFGLDIRAVHPEMAYDKMSTKIEWKDTRIHWVQFNSGSFRSEDD